MRNNRIVCLTLILVAVFRTIVTAATFDLAACIDRGLRLNPEIASRKIAIEESKKELNKAEALFLPTVSVNYQTSTLSNKGSLAHSRNYPDQSSSVTSFRLSQPLFTGFAGLTTLSKVQYVREYRQAELLEARLTLIREIQRQFFDYLRLLEDVATVNETIAGLTKQLKSANAFYEQRMAPQLQVLQAEVRLSSAQQNLIQVQTQVGNARFRLNEMIALRADETEAEYSGHLIDFDFQITKTLSDYASHLPSRPDLHMANIKIILARKESKLILARALPRVSVDADYNDRQLDYNYAGYKDYEEDYWTLGLNVSMNLFQGGADVAAYSQQLLAVSRNEEDLRKLRNQIDREVLVAYASQQEAMMRIDSAVKIKEVALAALDRARTAFELGLGTTITVLDAQQEVSQAMVGIAKARTDFLLAKVDLEYLAAQDDGYSIKESAPVAPIFEGQSLPQSKPEPPQAPIFVPTEETTQAVPLPLPPPTTLGSVEVEKGVNLSKMVARVYGRYSPQKLALVLQANPDITTPDNIKVNTTIHFPILAKTDLSNHANQIWVELAKSKTLSEAYGIVKEYPETAPSLLIKPILTAENSLIFHVIMEATFDNENSAIKQLKDLPQAWQSKARVTHCLP